MSKSLCPCPKCGAKCESSLEDFLTLKQVCFACGSYKQLARPLTRSDACRTGELEIKMQRLHELESQVKGLQRNRQALRKIITELAGVRLHLDNLEANLSQAIREMGE